MTEASDTSRRPRRVLVTGATGQDGSWLCEQLVAEGAEVHGLVRRERPVLPAGVVPLAGDLRDEATLRAAIAACRPDEVYHLAAATSVAASWEDPAGVEDVNVGGTTRLLAALGDLAPQARFCHASSAEIFGAPTGSPQGEDCPLAANTPYGRSKVAAHLAVAAARDRGLFACSAILFNHESPRRPPSFVTRRISIAVARIARGLQHELVLGNLGAARDWGYAPEYVEAMTRMLRAPRAGDYVVATGRAITVGRFAELAFAAAGLDWTRFVRTDSALVRPGEEAARVGDPSRIARELGWRARTTVEELAALMVDADLRLLAPA